MLTRYSRGGEHIWCSFEVFVLRPIYGPIGPRIPVGLFRGTVSWVHWSRELEIGAHFSILVEGKPIRSNLEKCFWFCVVGVVYVLIPHRAVEFCNVFSNNRAALLCVSRQTHMFQISLISHSSCLMALTDVGKAHLRSIFIFFLMTVFRCAYSDVHNQVLPDATVYRYPCLLQGFAIALYVP